MHISHLFLINSMCYSQYFGWFLIVQNICSLSPQFPLIKSYSQSSLRLLWDLLLIKSYRQIKELSFLKSKTTGFTGLHSDWLTYLILKVAKLLSIRAFSEFAYIFPYRSPNSAFWGSSRFTSVFHSQIHSHSSEFRFEIKLFSDFSTLLYFYDTLNRK